MTNKLYDFAAAARPSLYSAAPTTIIGTHGFIIIITSIIIIVDRRHYYYYYYHTESAWYTLVYTRCRTTPTVCVLLIPLPLIGSRFITLSLRSPVFSSTPLSPSFTHTY